MLIAAGRLTPAQTVTVGPTADAWRAGDSIRFETYLGRPNIYIDATHR